VCRLEKYIGCEKKMSLPLDDEAIQRKRVIAAELGKAIDRKQFHLHYQPLVDVKRGIIMGMEALLRWNHPELGNVPPTEFIPIAEESDMIKRIGEWVIYKACMQNTKWQKAGFVPIRVAVNISPIHFQDSWFVHLVKQALIETELDPAYLEIEITENSLLNDIDESVQKINELKRMGVRVAIDDFGTGYSSLSYLKQLPIDSLKIDKSFVMDLEKDKKDSLIVAAIINLAHALGLEVIAEGVETREAVRFLAEKKCHGLQGYLFSKPVPHFDAENLIRRPYHYSHLLA
jgi:EAL domain-containing protein (putative c-di-GMP-specific phosphodiesterase class I)